MSRLLTLTFALALLAGCATDPCALWGDETDLDGDGWICAEDCLDLSADIYPGAPELCDGWDNDCDGIVPLQEFDQDGDGYLGCGPSLDCGPTLFQVHPGAPEYCDGWDNDCNPSTPRFPGELTDADNDGSPVCADCDDQDSTIWPGGLESCDGADTDCNGVADSGGIVRHTTLSEGADIPTLTRFAANLYFLDEAIALTSFSQRLSYASGTWGPPPRMVVLVRDANYAWGEAATFPLQRPFSGDWWRTGTISIPLAAGEMYWIGITDAGQHFEGPVALNPGSPGLPFGVASANAAIDAPYPFNAIPHSQFTTANVQWAQSLAWRRASEVDEDGDNILACAECGDAGAEICDGFDGDCDGAVPPDEVDHDFDGWLPCAGDCDDYEGSTAPNDIEQCDGVDSNCLPEAPDAEETDEDGDGWSPCEGDCDDTDADTYPGATESCDSIDRDCDGDTQEWRIDTDGDGVWDCFDCDENDASAAPGLPEICHDGVDNDCDGVDPSPVDLDIDGFNGCQGDCDNSDPSVYPGAPELDDGLDNDCDGSVDGLVPSVRVAWSDLEVDSVEGFWGPVERQADWESDFVAFTRRGDGTIVDIEPLLLDPRFSDIDDLSLDSWSEVHGSLRLEGELWLRANEAVQLVIASTAQQPWVELDVQLLPAPTAYPSQGARSGAGMCWDLPSYGTPQAALEAMESIDYFPWIEVTEPPDFGFWNHPLLNLPCADDAFGPCNFWPSMDQLVEVCEGLRASAPAVAASVSSIEWTYIVPPSVGVQAGAGRILLDVNQVRPPGSARVSMAHEAAHAFTRALEDWSPVTAPPELTSLVAAGPLSRGHSPRNLVQVFGLLAENGDDVTDCTSTTQYTNGFEPASSGQTAAAWECGFTRMQINGDYYGRTRFEEDIATWVETAVEHAYAGTPELFCGDLTADLETVPANRILHLGKMLLLDLGGFLPATVSNGCVAALTPGYFPAANGNSLLWSASSEWEFGFAVPADFSMGVANFAIVEDPGYMMGLYLTDEALPYVGRPTGVYSLAEANTDTSDPSDTGTWVDPSLDTYSYFERLTNNTSSSGGCSFWPNYPLNPGTYGRSYSGSALVVSNEALSWGLALVPEWSCGAYNNGQNDYQTAPGTTVFFQVAD